ncbi:MAG TPA: aminotransferase class III-fold pyridoxal phosphate-dependent enzyme, partial [Candidatus Limnocylindria bacterium]|nr:aminotransferase class III-fold pyridoxal phosphate-dependent enzyme [Candidatus Limnocylindria bacterium]
VLTSDGIFDLQPSLAQELVRRTHAAGGLWIADEVQSGHGRTGSWMWGYQRLAIEPDIVTLGKPMGNGMPIAAVLTRRELAARFSADGEFFSTYGGNPVAAAAGLAVLDVLDDYRVLDNVRAISELLVADLRRLAAAHGLIGEVRAVGLAIGVEMTDATAAREVMEGMRERGVLIGISGRRRNVLKIRPPLNFDRDHVKVLTDTMADALAAQQPRSD